jgi:hypothetical protein
MSFNRDGVASTYASHSDAIALFDLGMEADAFVVAVEAVDLGAIIGIDWLYERVGRDKLFAWFVRNLFDLTILAIYWPRA